MLSQQLSSGTDVGRRQETLISRDVILSEHRSAVKATRSKRDIIERLKNSSSIKAEKVDDALDELEDVSPPSYCLAIDADARRRPRNTKLFSRNDFRISLRPFSPRYARILATPTRTSLPLYWTTLDLPSSTNVNCSRSWNYYDRNWLGSRNQRREYIIINLHRFKLRITDPRRPRPLEQNRSTQPPLLSHLPLNDQTLPHHHLTRECRNRCLSIRVDHLEMIQARSDPSRARERIMDRADRLIVWPRVLLCRISDREWTRGWQHRCWRMVFDFLFRAASIFVRYML